MRGVSKFFCINWRQAAWGLLVLICGTQALAQDAAVPVTCQRPIYLTLDTGHMGVAPLMAQVLKDHHVRVTFFAANEPTQQGDGTLGEYWAPWWRARAQEGHEFASHTYDHVYWRKDLPGDNFLMRPSAGPEQGQTRQWSAKAYCEEIRKANDRLQTITGVKPLPLFRAPGGKTSPQLLRVAQQCGFLHVGWSAAGFLGDELPSETYPNDKLLHNALNHIREGDILMAHLGIWSRQEVWAPAVLAPLIEGLQQKGFCFETLSKHPAYQSWIH